MWILWIVDIEQTLRPTFCLGQNNHWNETISRTSNDTQNAVNLQVAWSGGPTAWLPLSLQWLDKEG